MKLEDQLRQALRREQPPADFAQRVVAKVESVERQSPLTSNAMARRRFIGLVTAAAIAITTGSSLYYAHRRQVSETERVRNEAVVGLRIASAKLNAVHDRLLQRIAHQNEGQK